MLFSYAGTKPSTPFRPVTGALCNTKTGVLAIKPFHLSFVVPNLEEARTFYVDVLGCSVAQDRGQWINIVFFGHQLTIHQQRDGLLHNKIDHFGPILDKDLWLSLSELLTTKGVSFLMSPTIKENGLPTESGKYMVSDPAGNVLEFKYYSDLSMPVESKNA